MAKTKEVFPAGDPVARFVVAMWAARQDIEYAAERVGAANDKSEPEFFYLVRLATGHLLEAATALADYREHCPEVDRFIQRLPPDAQKAMRKAANVASQVGGKALSHSRDRTFHYPTPDPAYTTDDELAEALRALASEEAAFAIAAGPMRRVRLETADKALLFIAMSKHDSEEAKLRAQVEKTLEGAGAFTRFVRAAWDQYYRERDLTYDPHPSGNGADPAEVG